MVEVGWGSVVFFGVRVVFVFFERGASLRGVRRGFLY